MTAAGARGRAGAATAALLAAVLLIAGCAPKVIGPGPPVRPPALEGDALVTADGLRLPLRRWSPEPAPARAVIVALHGFNDYSNAFAMPAAFWARHGIVTYAYDQRGFGAAPNRGFWPGTAALVDDLRSMVRLARARHPGLPVYALGESMGGAVVMTALAGADPPPVDGAILAAPAVWGRQTMDIFKRAALWLGTYTLPWLTVSGRGLGITPSDNVEMLKALAADPLVIKETRIDAIHGVVDLMDAAFEAASRLTAPVLILYGARDEVIPKEPTIRMIERLPPAPPARRRIAIYREGYHMLLRDLEAETVWRDVLHWIEDPASPLPSGADRVDPESLLAGEE